MKKLIVFLYLLIVADSYASYFPLKETFFLDDLKSLTLEEASVAQPTPATGKAKLYVKNGELTILDDTGTETAVGTVSDHNDTTNIQGGTSGEYYHLTNTQHNEVTTEIDPTYIKNGGAEQALSGWSCSANVTIARNTTTPLKGTGDFVLDVTSSAVAGNYCQYAFTATNADMETKMLTASIDAIKYISAYNTGDIRICIYDITAAKCLRTDFFFDTSPKFSADYQIETNSSLALRFEVVTPSVARELRLEGISVKPQAPSVTGLAGWKQYDLTVTGTGWTTTLAKGIPYKTLDGVWRLQFNVTGTATAGTRTSYAATISGVTFAAFTQAISARQGTDGISGGRAVPNSGTLEQSHASLSTTDYTYSGDVELASKPTWAVDYSNVVLSSSTSGREIAFRLQQSNTTIAPSTTTALTFSSKPIDTVNAVSGSTFVTPEDGKYFFKSQAYAAMTPNVVGYLRISIRKGGTSISTMEYPAEATGTLRGYHLLVTAIADLKQGDVIDTTFFQNAQSSGNVNIDNIAAYSSFEGFRLNTGSQTTAKDAKGYAKYRLAGGESIGTSVTLLDFSVGSTDGIIKVTTGASWKAQCTRDGLFVAVGKILLTATSLSPTEQLVTYVYKNGSQLYSLDKSLGNGSSATHSARLDFSDKCQQNDYYEFYAASSVSTTISSTNPSNNTYLIMTMD
jgi:hypothetical protein